MKENQLIAPSIAENYNLLQSLDKKLFKLVRIVYTIRELSIHSITSGIVYEILKKLDLLRLFLKKSYNSS